MFINKSLLGSMQHHVLSEPKKFGSHPLWPAGTDTRFRG